MAAPAFRFVDLFAGVGGFHAALSSLGGECVYAVENDKAAAAVYQHNWGINAFGDITQDANNEAVNVPPHDVLAAGFPCQPFSKSGAQKGMDETRGTLYWNILHVIQAQKPEIVVLENVRNLAGPRHRHEWEVMIATLRDQDYYVSDVPAVLSPHQLPPGQGGSPQTRERVFITATRIPTGMADDPSLIFSPDPVQVPSMQWDPQMWQLEDLLDDGNHIPGCELTPSERLWLNAWNDFVEMMWEQREGHRLLSFPLWADAWRDLPEAWCSDKTLVPDAPRIPEIDSAVPSWKRNILAKNYTLFAAHHRKIRDWTEKWGIYTNAFPSSRRKLEWQAQENRQIWDTLIQLRPSGIRCKAPTYLPALVAITQTSIIGPRGRRLSPREAARLQGLPDTFNFGSQSPAVTYKQLGNSINVGVAWNVMRQHVRRDEWLLKHTPAGAAIVQSVMQSSNLDLSLRRHSPDARWVDQAV